jgi:hypothetical protein
LLKKGHLLRFPHPSSLRRTAKYASLLRISGALHLALFEQPGKDDLFSSLSGLSDDTEFDLIPLKIAIISLTPPFLNLLGRHNFGMQGRNKKI